MKDTLEVHQPLKKITINLYEFLSKIKYKQINIEIPLPFDLSTPTGFGLFSGNFILKLIGMSLAPGGL